MPSVIANFQRGGPGIGDIKPAQQDYFQATKAAGNGGFQMLVLAPCSVQDAVDMTFRSFELADKYRMPTYLLLDGMIGAMMEPVYFPEPLSDEEVKRIRESKTYAARGRKGGKFHQIQCGPGLDPNINQEELNRKDMARYEPWQRDEVEYEMDVPEDTELILTGYGSSGRIAKVRSPDSQERGLQSGLYSSAKGKPLPL